MGKHILLYSTVGSTKCFVDNESPKKSSLSKRVSPTRQNYAYKESTERFTNYCLDDRAF